MVGKGKGRGIHILVIPARSAELLETSHPTPPSFLHPRTPPSLLHPSNHPIPAHPTYTSATARSVCR